MYTVTEFFKATLNFKGAVVFVTIDFQLELLIFQIHGKVIWI